MLVRCLRWVVLVGLVVLGGCAGSPRLVEMSTIAFFDEAGNYTTRASVNGSYRQLLRIQSNGYLVQNFFVGSNVKQTDPFIIADREDLTAVDPLSIDGFFVQWHRNGEKAGSGHFVRGKRVGTFTQWTEQGVKWTEMNFDNDLPNGKAALWYEDGSRYIEGQYLAGMEEGEWRIWQQNGMLRFCAMFEHGRVVSAVDAQGKAIKLSREDFAN